MNRYSTTEIDWAFLSRMSTCSGTDRVQLHALLADHGAQGAAAVLRDQLARSSALPRDWADAAHADLDAAAALGARMLTPADEEWPSHLRPSSPEPERPGAFGAAPIVLWVTGAGSLAELTRRAVAVVGSRACSNYGTTVTGQITTDLVTAGVTVASDVGFGISRTAHLMAALAGGPTLGVLGAGIAAPHPAPITDLAASVLAGGGVIVGEYPGATPVSRRTGGDGRRLLAWLTRSTVVIEAAPRSGCTATVAWARRFGRPAFAVPGSVLSPNSVGVAQMLRDGRARAVLDAADLRRFTFTDTPHNPPGTEPGDR